MWLAGIVAALSTFGIKTGVGMATRIYDVRRSITWKVCFLLAVTAGYALFFIAGDYVLEIIRDSGSSDTLLKLLESGAWLHLLTALGLVVWGIVLLRNGHDHSGSALGALLLIAPCPVCALSLLMLLAFSRMLIESWPPLVLPLIFTGIFCAIAFGTVAVFFLARRKLRHAGGIFTGGAMTCVGMYFLLLLLIGPNFEKIVAVHRMALRGNASNGLHQPLLWLTLLAVVLVFSAGWLRNIAANRKANFSRNK